MELKKFSLKEIASIQTGPFGSQLHNKDYVERGIPIVTVEHLGEKNFSTQNLPMVSITDATRLNKYSLRNGDIVFSRVGAVDRCSLVDKNQNGWLFSGRCLRLRALGDIDSTFLYYYLSREEFKSYIKNVAVGCTMPSLNSTILGDAPIWLPSKDWQIRIGRTLEKIDRKIALNREINRNLEAMARQLYDYWFVQFDFPDENGRPYKSSGGKMVWNEKLKREIPEGWTFTTFENICQVNRGASPRPIDAFMDETHKGMPWLKISDATSSDSPFIHTIKEHIIEQGIRKSVTVLPNTLVVSNSATPGIPKFMGITACVHDGWLVLTKYQPELKYFLFFAIQDLRSMLVNTASGSVFKNLKTDYLKQAPITLPPGSTICSFHNRITSIMETVNVNTQGIIELQRQRDELLPLLMNGQVSVMPSEVNCDLQV